MCKTQWATHLSPLFPLHSPFYPMWLYFTGLSWYTNHSHSQHWYRIRQRKIPLFCTTCLQQAYRPVTCVATVVEVVFTLPLFLTLYQLALTTLDNIYIFVHMYVTSGCTVTIYGTTLWQWTHTFSYSLNRHCSHICNINPDFSLTWPFFTGLRRVTNSDTCIVQCRTVEFLVWKSRGQCAVTSKQTWIVFSVWLLHCALGLEKLCTSCFIY